MMENLLSNMHGAQDSVHVLHFPSHSPFFPAATASDILTRIESLLPPSEPYTHTVEVPLSPDLQHTVDGAKDVQNMFHHKQIEPLHLFAALPLQEQNQQIKALRAA